MRSVVRHCCPVAAAICLAMLVAACSFDDGSDGAPSMYPIDGSRAANAQTTISFRNVTPDDLDDLTVTGSSSGRHDGEVEAHLDGDGATFRPERPFEPGEDVVVATDTEIVGDDEIGFHVAVPGGPPDDVPTGGPSELPDPEILELSTMPDAAIPVASVEGDAGDRMFLATPAPLGDSAAGAEIIDADGELVWWYAPPTEDLTIGNLAVHELDGEPVLAWFEGTAPFGVGKYEGEWVVVDSAYEEVARIEGANGIPSDIHDLVITDDGTAVVVAYQPVTMDLTDEGGLENTVVLDSVVQEIDLRSGDVYFEWHSLDHVPVTETRTEGLSGAVVDYSHINSVDVGPDGNVLISLRHTSQVLEVDRSTGEPVWILGGDANTVDVGDDPGISFPHHARWLDDGTVSIFDNGVERNDPASRGVVYEFSDDRSSAEAVATYAADPALFTATQGSIEVGDDDALAMWSERGVATRFDGDGERTGTIDLSTVSYRLFSADWVGRPSAPPVAIVVGDRIVVSWNGATEVKTWEAMVDDDVVGSAPAAGFETMIEIPNDTAADALFTVRAVTGDGDVIPGSTTRVPLGG